MNKEGNISQKADVALVMNDNLAEAESSISDMDMAKEMMRSIKNSICSQPSEAMLAQTSNLPYSAQELIE